MASIVKAKFNENKFNENKFKKKAGAAPPAPRIFVRMVKNATGNRITKDEPRLRFSAFTWKVIGGANLFSPGSTRFFPTFVPQDLDSAR